MTISYAKEKIRVMESYVEMYESLLDSIDQAGGSAGWYTIEHIKDMKVTELIARLAPNNVRFCFNKEDKSLDAVIKSIENIADRIVKRTTSTSSYTIADELYNLANSLK